MEGVNTKFKKIMLKMFDLTESWQHLHRECCDDFMVLVQDLSSWENVTGGEYHHSDAVSEGGSNYSPFGIFQYFPQTVQLIQGTYVKKLDERYEKIVSSLYVSYMCVIDCVYLHHYL